MQLPKPETQVFEMGDRLPPQSIDAEMAVLGCLLFDPSAIEVVVDTLRPEDFYISGHQIVYQAMLELHQQGNPTDLMCVVTKLADKGLLEKVGGRQAIANMFDSVITAVNVDKYAELVIEKSNRRRLIKIADQLNAYARDGQKTWQSIKDAAEKSIYELSESSAVKGLAPIEDILIQEMARIEEVSVSDAPVGTPTGFYDLDAMTQGFKPGELIILAGRPAMGKSAFAGAIARNVAEKRPVALFSLEMDEGQVIRRFISAESGVDAGRLASGRIGSHEWGSLGQALSPLSKLNLAIDCTFGASSAHMLSQCRKYRARRGDLGLIIVDYLHLMLRGQNEVQELGRLSREFKIISGELKVPVILLSQISRGVEERADKRPSLSDLRQSGEIEQNADCVIFLYRDEYYNPDTPDRGITELIIRKNRNGPIGTAKVLFEPQFTRFKNLARQNHGY